MYLRGLVLLTLLLPDAARRSLRIADTFYDALQQTNKYTQALEVSSEAREAFLPHSVWTAPLRRRGPHANALHAANGHGPQLHAPHGPPLSMRHGGPIAWRGLSEDSHNRPLRTTVALHAAFSPMPRPMASTHRAMRDRRNPQRNGRVLLSSRGSKSQSSPDDSLEEEMEPLLQPLLDELFEENDLQKQLVELPIMFTGEKDGQTFDIDRWNTHRSSSRYVRLLFGVFSSVTTRRILIPLIGLGLWSGAVELYNSVDRIYGLPELELPLTPFELTAPILGLLLVFRSDRAFDRFSLGSDYSWEITNLFKSLVREILSFSAADRYSREERAAAYELAEACVQLHGWIMKDHLRGKQISVGKQEEFLRLALGRAAAASTTTNKSGPLTPASVKAAISRRALRPSASKATINGGGPDNGWMQEPLTPSSGVAALSLGLNLRLPSLDFQELTLLESQLSDVVSSLAKCEMMLRTPIPLGYTRYSVRFLWIWLSLLPLALVNKFAEFGIGTWWEDKPQPVLVVAMLFIGFIFSSIEDIAVQIEEPFGVLPLELHLRWLAREAGQVEGMNRYVDRMREEERIGSQVGRGMKVQDQQPMEDGEEDPAAN